MSFALHVVDSVKHPALRDAMALTRQGAREQTGRYLAEDAHLAAQALRALEAEVESVFATQAEATALRPLCEERGVPLYSCTGGLLQKLVGTGYDTAVTAVAVVKKREASLEALLAPGAVVLCGERIQDPRNVGVLVRTADALGCAGLLFSADSAEPWSRAAVRSTTGSILRARLRLAADLGAELDALRARGARVVSSSGSAKEKASEGALRARPLVLVLGNEQEGISEAVRSRSDAVVRLPMAEGTGADSFNVTVAAGMLLYEALRS